MRMFVRKFARLLIPFGSIPHDIDPDGEARVIIGSGFLIFFIVFILGGLWLSMAPLAGAIVASGTLKIEDNRKTIQHLEGGIVQSILVKEGDEVVAGQPLLVLADTQTSSLYSMLQDQLDAEHAKEARLAAEAIFSNSIHFENVSKSSPNSKIASLCRNEEDLFRAHRTSIEGQILLMQNQIAQTKGEASGLEQQIRYADEGIDYLKQQLDANEALYTKNFVQKTRLLDFKRALSEKEEKKGEYVANLAMAKQKTSELELRIISLKNAYQQDAINELKETRKRIYDLQDRMKPSEDMLRRLTIRAPVAGQVVGLRVHTPGGTVSPREPLLDIVPQQSHLIVESKIQPQDIAHVKVGQSVEMRITAFNRRSTPALDGNIKYLSSDSFTDSPMNGGRNYYLAFVEIQPESLKKLKDKQLTAGMPVETYIKTGERTALEYLLDPMTSRVSQAFREP